MSSYHSSFTYLNKNSSGEGFFIASFDTDDGFMDSYLGMDQITDDSFDGTRKNYYGSKYNNVATISITLIKHDGTDFTMADNRRVLRWFTGSRKVSWLDFYVYDTLVYSFYGNVTSCEQYKLDGRIVGVKIEFTCIHPWAWSAPQTFDGYVGEDSLVADENGVIYKGQRKLPLFADKAGVIFNGDGSKTFSVTNRGVIYNNVAVDESFGNDTDDLCSYIYLDIVFNNETASELIIDNKTLDEKTIISGIRNGENISIHSGHFITSSRYRIFGDDFNFIWPRLAPGNNEITINVNGIGSIHFSYRYPIKIGDCAIDVDKLDINPMYEGKISGAIGSIDGIITLGRENITLTDVSTKEPYTVSVIDGYMVVSNASVPNKNRTFLLADGEGNVVNKIIIKDDTLYLTKGVKDESAVGRKRIVFVDESTQLPYEVIVQDNSLYISEM